MPSDTPHTLSKEERLCGKTAISHLCEKGKWGVLQPVKFCFLDGNGTELNRIMVSVPKRNFKRAVKRNLLKRRMRECYRLQKELLSKKGIDILFTYNSTEIIPTNTLHDLIGTILKDIDRRTA